MEKLRPKNRRPIPSRRSRVAAAAAGAAAAAAAAAIAAAAGAAAVECLLRFFIGFGFGEETEGC